MKILYKRNITTCSSCPYFRETLVRSGYHLCSVDNTRIGIGKHSLVYKTIHMAECNLPEDEDTI